MKGFVGIGHADQIDTAIAEATNGMKKADFLILIAPYAKAEQAAALLAEKYPGTPMLGTSGNGIAKDRVIKDQIIVIGFAGVEVCTGLIEDVRTTPVKSLHAFLQDLDQIQPGSSDTICLEFITGSEDKVLSTIHIPLQEAGVPLVGASAYGVLLGEKHMVIKDGRCYTHACAYAFLKNKSGNIHVYKENIYKRQSRRAHFATLVEPGTKTLFQLDGCPALELYQEETGVALEDIIPAMKEHPLGRALGDDTTIIQAMSVDRNGVMFNGKAIYENDSVYIMQCGDYRQIHNELLSKIRNDSETLSFLLGFDSENRLKLFEEGDFLTEYITSFGSLSAYALFSGDGAQLNNQHMNQTLIIVAFE